MAEIYSESGFKGHVIDRINFMEKVSVQEGGKEKRVLINFCSLHFNRIKHYNFTGNFPKKIRKF